MAVAIITPLFPPDTDSTARYACLLAEALSHSKKVEVFTFGDIPPAPSKTFDIHSISRKKSTFARIALLLLSLIQRRERIDSIVLFDGLSVGLVSVFFARFFRIPIQRVYLQNECISRSHSVAHTRIFIQKLFLRGVSWAQTFVWKISNSILIHSPHLLSSLTDAGIPNDKIFLTQYTLPTAFVQVLPSHGIEFDRVYIDIPVTAELFIDEYFTKNQPPEHSDSVQKLSSVEGLARQSHQDISPYTSFPMRRPASRPEIAYILSSSRAVVIGDRSPALHDLLSLALALEKRVYLHISHPKTPKTGALAPVTRDAFPHSTDLLGF